VAEHLYDRAAKRVEEKRAARKQEIENEETRLAATLAQSPEQQAHTEIGEWHRIGETFSEEELVARIRAYRASGRAEAAIEKLRERDRRLRKGERTRLRHMKEKLNH